MKCEIRLLFIRQCSAKEKEAVRPWIKRAGGRGGFGVGGGDTSDLQCRLVTPG